MLRRAKPDLERLCGLPSKIHLPAAECFPKGGTNLFRKCHSAGAWPYRSGRRRNVLRWWPVARGVRRAYPAENDLAARRLSREGSRDLLPARCSALLVLCSLEKRERHSSRNPASSLARKTPNVRAPKGDRERCGSQRNRGTRPSCARAISRGRDRESPRFQCAGLER